MRDAMSVLIRPVVSEKSYGLMDHNVYVFIVDPGATKIDVRHAVEQAIPIDVEHHGFYGGPAAIGEPIAPGQIPAGIRRRTRIPRKDRRCSGLRV